VEKSLLYSFLWIGKKAAVETSSPKATQSPPFSHARNFLARDGFATPSGCQNCKQHQRRATFLGALNEHPTSPCPTFSGILKPETSPFFHAFPVD
jgi:hypothetical protein